MDVSRSWAQALGGFLWFTWVALFSTRMLDCEDLKDVMLLVIANKQDRADSMSSAEIAENMKLHNISDRKWFIQSTCATTGDGVFTALDWLQFQLE